MTAHPKGHQSDRHHLCRAVDRHVAAQPRRYREQPGGRRSAGGGPPGRHASRTPKVYFEPTRVAPTGSQPFAFILCKFAGAGETWQTTVDFEKLLFGPEGLDAYWREASYGRINLAGHKVVGWYTLPQDAAAYRTVDGSDMISIAWLWTAPRRPTSISTSATTQGSGWRSTSTLTPVHGAAEPVWISMTSRSATAPSGCGPPTHATGPWLRTR